jgi:lysophospholipase L1-like esterase
MGQTGFGPRTMKQRVLVALTLMLALVMVSAPSVAGATKQKIRRPGPLRVLLVGDSLTTNYGPVAAPRLRLLGYQVTIASTGGSGLLDADKCHGRYAKQLLKTVEPDVVVYQNKGNYNLLTPYGVPPCRPLLDYGTPPFYNRWERAARQSQKILSRYGARFIWVLNPSVALNIDPGRQIVPHLNRIYSTLAPSGGFVDAWTPFGGATYDPALHQPDGLHLSAAGSELMANLVVAAIG